MHIPTVMGLTNKKNEIAMGRRVTKLKNANINELKNIIDIAAIQKKAT